MIYDTDAAFRAALEARLANRSRESGTDLNRLRRRVVFERALARLNRAEPGRWVLKGGMALEVRWKDRARATRDLDLAVVEDGGDRGSVRSQLAAGLAEDRDGDRFTFHLGVSRDLRDDEAGRPGWRLPVQAALAGRLFAAVSVDVVVRPDEITRTERLPLPGSLAFAGIAPGEVEVVDRSQHFAEKLHALTRTYAGGANTRVKDLVDLILLIDDELPPSPELRHAVHQVFASRDTHAIPDELRDPPHDWAARYAELAADLRISARTVDDAMRTLRTFWRLVQPKE